MTIDLNFARVLESESMNSVSSECVDAGATSTKVSERQEIRRHLILVLASAGVTQLLVALIYILCARSGQPERYGPIAAGIGVASLAAVVVDFGGSTYMVRELSAQRDRMYNSWLLSKFLIIMVATPMIGVMAAVIAVRAAWTLSLVVWLAVLFAGVSLSMLFAVPLRVEMAFGTIALVQVLSRFPFAVGALALQSAHRLQAQNLVVLLAGTYVSEAAMYVVRQRIRGKTWVIRRATLMNPFVGSTGVGVNSSINALSGLDAAVISATGGASAAGQFAGVSKWTAPIGLVATAISQTMFPRMSRARPDQRSKLLLVSLAYLGLALPVLVAVAWFAPAVVHALLGAQYSNSAGALRILCVALVFALANQPLNSTLIAWGEERAASVILVISMVVQLSCQALLAAHFGALGAAWGAAVGQCVAFAGYAWAAKQAAAVVRTDNS
jgi:lipopolysaccharide exporter